ncbi:MAG TPA: DsbA family protein [Dongiaceae bacterium]|jgi:protein-disulfide isomerase|nr:DsbA family protein [Dongiaceae bacterium]
MSTADKRSSGRRVRLGVAAGLILIILVAFAWLLFGRSIVPLLGLSDDSVSQLISERWLQIFYDRSSPDTGPDGNVIIVAFLDYDSADCREVGIALGKLHDVDRGVRIVFKELGEPGSMSEFAARAALAADRQDGFLSFHKELTHGPSQLTESSVIMAAGMAGLDLERLRADMNDPVIKKAIEENRSLAQALGIASPAVIIGHRVLRGAIDLASIQAAVASERARPSL